MAHGVAVIYTVDKGRLRITGLSASSGDKLWSHAATSGEIGTGRSMYAHVNGTKVVWYVRAPDTADWDGRWVVVRVADVRSGKILVTGRQALFATDLPYACGKDGTDTCIEATPGGTVGPMRVDLRTARARSISAQRGIEVMDGLVLISDTELARFAGGKRRWRLSVTKLGKEYDLWSGWAIQHPERSGVFVASIAQGSDRERLDREVTAGIDENTGRIRWKRLGISLFCTSHGVPDVTFGCASTGVIDRREGICHGLASRAERIDPATGKALWSVDLGRSIAVEPLSAGCEPELVQRSDTEILALFAGRGQRIAWADGTSSRLEGQDVVWVEAVDQVEVDGEERVSDAARLRTVVGAPTDRLPTWVPPRLGAETELKDVSARIVTLESAVVALAP